MSGINITAKTDSPGIYIYGAGGHAKVVSALVSACGHEVRAFLDDRAHGAKAMLMGRPMLEPAALIGDGNDLHAIIAIGDNSVRQKKAEMWSGQLKWESLIHPFTWIHPTVKIAEGTVVFAGAVVQPDTEVGCHVIINTRAAIDHDCRIGDFVHIAPGTSLAGNVLVGEGSLLGIGASVIPGVKVGKHCIIGAGAAVVRDIPDYSVAVGVPARVIKKLK